MSNYTKATNFATKDSLPTGSALKIVSGTEIDTEFSNIETAVNTKANISSPIFTGDIGMPDNSIDKAMIGADQVDGSKIEDDSINSEHIADGAIDLAHMSSQSVDEDNLYISNAGTDGQYLQKQSGNSGGLTWANVAGPAPQVSGHVRAGNTQIVDGSVLPTQFNVSSAISWNTWESVGPTGSGADNIYPTLDQVPSSARILLFDFWGQHSTSGSIRYLRASVASGDVASPSYVNVLEMLVDTLSTDSQVGQRTRIAVPCNSSQVFKLYIYRSGGSNGSINCAYRGFITD